MPHGTPDWGHVGPKSTTYGLDDLGEHAVRLGSPHLWDRRGDVVYETNFSEGLGIFTIFLFGLGAGGTLFTGNARSGAFCVQLTGGSDGERMARLLGLIPFPRLDWFGLEFTFSVSAQTEFWRWNLVWHINLVQYNARIQVDCVNNRLEYWGNDGLYHEFAAGVVLDESTELHHTGKVVVNTVDWRYVRFILNDVEYDLGQFAVETTGALAGNYFNMAVEHVSVALSNAVAYIDSVILTQNEP